MFKKPPFEITPPILEKIQDIFLILGRMEQCSFKVHSDIKLRKDNSIRSIKSSMAIEGNSLSLDQVTDILNGQKIIAPQKDITEVKNAITVYEKFEDFEVFDIDNLLEAHELMMTNLMDRAGRFRNGGVGIFKGNEAIHIAPPHTEVSGLIANLFSYLKNSDDSLLIKSCVFHYEFEFIHPFSDGNGRIGRLWQQLILAKLHPIFKLVCIEELLEKYQTDYYEALHNSDISGNSEAFIDFMLKVILETLQRTNLHLQTNTGNNFMDRLIYAKNFIDNFKRDEYLKLISGISTATASRDLQNGVKCGILKKANSGNQTIYIFQKSQLNNIDPGYKS